MWESEAAKLESGNVEYKYIIKDNRDGSIKWEEGPNRMIDILQTHDITLEDKEFDELNKAAA